MTDTHTAAQKSVTPQAVRETSASGVANATHYRRRSMWLDLIDESLEPRPALPGSLDVDVAIVGAGFTGLWTAYYLAKTDPHLGIAILEKEIAGFGASGRNGGWISPFFPASLETIAKHHGREQAIAMQRAMFDTVDHIGAVCAAEGIEARYHKGGVLNLATGTEQVERVREEPGYYRNWGVGEDEIMWLDADAVRGRLAVDGCLGGTYTTHCASLDPARVVRGLARVVEKLGVTIHEQTPVLSIENGKAVTAVGDVRAGVVVRGTEGFTPELPGARRDVIPTYSLMIATEPLPASFWNEVGWNNYETFTDGRHLYIYAMRTEDDRIALGGRGAPYHFNSKVRDEYEQVPGVHAILERVLKSLFPTARDAKITHTWGGSLGIPRDWFPSVGYDKTRGYAWGGGYVGDGVAGSNLAGRTLGDLINGRESELTALPWVDHRSPKWEPEPLRWLGVRTSLAIFASADTKEQKTGKPAGRAKLMKKVLPI
jgi:glycine/D-amino acid oxidase-like deaminating enzyme